MVQKYYIFEDIKLSYWLLVILGRAMLTGISKNYTFCNTEVCIIMQTFWVEIPKLTN